MKNDIRKYTDTRGGDEVNVADTETDEVSESSTSVEVDTKCRDKVAKIIAKVNQNLKRVSDGVRVVQLIRLKGIQTDDLI